MTMENRRSFLKISSAALAAFSIQGCSSSPVPPPPLAPKTNSPKHALVLWYSQAGHTRRIGRLIAETWRNRGLAVDAMDIREANMAKLASYDLLAVGTPVFYYDVPLCARQLLEKAQGIERTPSAAYVTFGGPGNNQHNTGMSILEGLRNKGAVPVAMKTFGNMSTFAPTWSIGNEERVLKYKHLPNEETYQSARAFADRILKNLQQGRAFEIKKEVSFDNLMKNLAPVRFTKILIGKHSINGKRCIGCGTCEEKCPVKAALPDEHRIDRDLCIACMGCINNCPAQAIEMEFMGHEVYGFEEFLRRNNVTIVEPA